MTDPIRVTVVQDDPLPTGQFDTVKDGGTYRPPIITGDWNFGRPGNTGYRSRVRRGAEPKRRRGRKEA